MMMTANKARALRALTLCNSRREACLMAGIAERTLSGYFHDSEFVAELNKAYDTMIADATRQAQKSLRQAVETLTEIITDKETNPYARINACKILIESTLKLIETNDILNRIEALERKGKTNENGI